MLDRAVNDIDISTIVQNKCFCLDCYYSLQGWNTLITEYRFEYGNQFAYLMGKSSNVG